MCIEGYLVASINIIPGGKYVSSLIIFMLMIFALFLAFSSGIPDCLVACCCPILYILYYYTIKTKN
jgi:hypothetical protein